MDNINKNRKKDNFLIIDVNPCGVRTYVAAGSVGPCLWGASSCLG